MLSTLTSRVVAVSAVSALAALGLVTSASVALADPPTFHGVPGPITVTAGAADTAAVTCAPPSGSTFAIGSTKVTCTATDPDNTSSPVSASFTVTVVGAAGQLVDLFQDVQGLGPGLANTVLIAQRAVAAGNTPRACLALNAFIIEVATHIPPLSPAITGDLYADAAQIQAVLGC